MKNMIKCNKGLSLHEAYKDMFPVGAAVNAELLEKYRGVIDAEFSGITPENEMKFADIHPYEDQYCFENADRLV